MAGWEAAEWKYKVGVIYPASSTVLEWEWKLVPLRDVSFHVVRIKLRGAEASREAIWDMVNSERVEQAARMLGEAGIDIVVFACTIGSLIGGPSWDRVLVERLERASGVPATTTSTEVVNALRAVGCRAVAVITPYIEELNRLEKEFLEAHGLRVVSIRGFGKIRDQEIARIAPEEVYHLAKEVDTPESDCIFLSCTNMRSIEAILRLERDLGKPVISSNSATLWGCLRRLGYSKPVRGYGKLLEEYLVGERA